jgi:hypothetical protein
LLEIESDVFELGNWLNFTQLEEHLTLDELYALHEALYRKEHRHNKMLAAMNGVDIEEGSETNETFEEIRARAEEELSGRSSEERSLEDMGIIIESDD